jgi:hypothetical protein
VQGAFVDDFDALMYPPAHPGTVQFLSNQVTNMVQNWGSGFTESAGRFVETAQRMYDSVYSENALRLARAAVRKVKHIFQTDEIRSLWEIGSIQNASVKMQRWIMADPIVRQAYYDQRISGYETYLDMEPGCVGKHQSDYRNVMNGMIVEDGEDLKMVQYFDELPEGEHALTHEDRVDIISTWDHIRALIEAGKEDPTSVFGSKM